MPRQAADCYYIRNPKGHSWARIFMSEGTRPGNGETVHWGCVSIISDFGNFGCIWGHMGKPLRQFLKGLEFSYAMQKLRGSRWKEFNFEESVKDLKATAREWQRNRGNAPFGKEDCHALVLAARVLEREGPMSSEMFVLTLENELCRHPLLSNRLELSERFCRYTPTPECKAFWDEIWPLLLADFEAESREAA